MDERTNDLEPQGQPNADALAAQLWAVDDPPRDLNALADYLLAAARLAAVGRPDALKAWPGHATSAGLDALEALRSRATTSQVVL
ncbi:MAG: hypothetical protein MK085_11265, partial [Phycisphaerales bacterium]|nr:hypothetical protein [Phycisphaerales bacterium]